MNNAPKPVAPETLAKILEEECREAVKQIRAIEKAYLAEHPEFKEAFEQGAKLVPSDEEYAKQMARTNYVILGRLGYVAH